MIDNLQTSCLDTVSCLPQVAFHPLDDAVDGGQML